MVPIFQHILAIGVFILLAVGAYSIPEPTEAPVQVAEEILEINIPSPSQNLPDPEESTPEPESDPAQSNEQENPATEPSIEIVDIVIEPEVEIETEIVAEEIPLSIPPVAEALPFSFAEINTAARSALVNILCTSNNGGLTSSISGSGVIIHESGVVLTNAHIAQFYLIEDYPTPGSVDCVIRSGSPARNMYRADLLYLAPQWVAENQDILRAENPRGTGEYDYALLLINETTNPNGVLPASFPHIPINVDDGQTTEGIEVLLASYPAGFVGSLIIQKSLYAASSVSTIGKLYTFRETTVDLFSVGNTIVAQSGSSGGAVVLPNGSLIGLIVTSTDGDATSDRDLRALSVPYINRDFTAFNNTSLPVFLAGDLKAQSFSFNSFIAPALTELIVRNL